MAPSSGMLRERMNMFGLFLKDLQVFPFSYNYCCIDYDI